MRSLIESENLPISLVGSAYDGVGINDAIVSARKAVNDLLGSDIVIDEDAQAKVDKAMASS